jgi:hypothetical protein
MPSPGTSLTQFKLKPQNDAYTVLLSISLIAMIAACVLLFYDLKKYPSNFPSGNIGQSPYPGGERAPGGPGSQPPQQPQQ